MQDHPLIKNMPHSEGTLGIRLRLCQNFRDMQAIIGHLTLRHADSLGKAGARTPKNQLLPPVLIHGFAHIDLKGGKRY